MTRFGHPLPHSTREAYSNADAILVSSPTIPPSTGSGPISTSPGACRACTTSRAAICSSSSRSATGANELAIARAFEIAAVRRARLTSVGSTPDWDELVTAEAEGWDGLEVELLTLARRAHPLP